MKILIEIKNGFMDVSTDIDTAEVLIIDYDIQGVEEDRLEKVGKNKAIVSDGGASYSPKKINRLFKKFFSWQ